jgi:hypothetical protein
MLLLRGGRKVKLFMPFERVVNDGYSRTCINICLAHMLLHMQLITYSHVTWVSRRLLTCHTSWKEIKPETEKLINRKLERTLMYH